jgi:thiosulfate reductase/polysulfide reductase chain A
VPSLAVAVPAFEPKYETKPAYWMVRELALRLGLEQSFPWQDYSEVLDWELRQAGTSLEEMRQIGVKRFPRTKPMYFADGQEIQFKTHSGKIELYSKTLKDAGHDPMPRYTPPQDPPENHYRLIYGRGPAHSFGRTSNNPLLFELMPENTVWVNPLTAMRLGVGSGDYRRLRNPDGVISNPIRVRVTERIGPDAVFIAHGFGHTARGLRLADGVGADDAALMTNVKIDPICGSTGMRANYVTLVEA